MARTSLRTPLREAEAACGRPRGQHHGKARIMRTEIIAAFTGSRTIETAISERLGITGDLIEQNDLYLPDGSLPPEDWPCAIFKPEADMYLYPVQCTSDGMLADRESCACYGLPEEISSAVYMILEGDEPDVMDFVQSVCDLSGMSCFLIEDLGTDYSITQTVRPEVTPRTEQGFLDLLADYPEY